jgi:hypothetical protein
MRVNTFFALAMSLGGVAAGTAQADDLTASFKEETQTSGIDSIFTGEWEYMVGGGTAVFDCNGDELPDVYLAGGVSPAKFYKNISKRAEALRFEAHISGLEVDKVLGAYPINIDGDEHVDVVVLRQGENLVMRGRGDCQFVRANEEWGFNGGDAWSAALAATWEKDASWPTLAIGNYIDRNEEISPWGSCTDNWLHRPSPDKPKSFADPVALKPSFCPLSMLFSDWNRSGTPSLRVTNDRQYYEGGREQMWRVEAGKTPTFYEEKEGWQYLRIWGMGIASSDLDFDGFPEYALTSMADNKLQTLGEVKAGVAPMPVFKDVAYSKGVTAHRPYAGDDLRPSTAWHIQFEDVNNDGFVDLFIAKGNVAEMPDFAMKDPNNLLLQQEDGHFAEYGEKAGVASMEQSRGAALADFNLDGLVDLLVVNRGSRAQVWRNTTPATGHWLGLKLKQEGANRDAIGAWIEVQRDGKIMGREITIGGGHASGQLTWWHVGLGKQSQAQVRVRWPDGAADDWQALPADQFYVFERGKSAQPWAGD